ncbi:DEAD/DEAH box helicase [Dactylosporangium siamense]|uniref:AAA family ATPase n=1 Tax=Dactylosporangium siamense TaxID=685454 RepID=A0A919UE19_9ACTN|nr:AAA domain-containing protein [Dactylosporangium siamense]GIG52014.1 hypothetical protein Dsi01nite_100550 [Dactylosporangium siamense]
MTVVEVRLPGPLALVPSQGAMRRLGHDLPDPVTLAAELTRLSQRDGLPARIDESRSRPSLAVYTDSCVLWLGLTQNGDAYRINGAAPKGLKDHASLVKGALLLRTGAAWWALPDVADVARMRRERGMTFDTSFSQLLAAWRAGLAVAASPPANPAHTRFLDVLTEVVEAGREIDAAKLRDAEPLRYRQRAATREQRHSARGVYDFTLLRRPDLVKGAVVRIEERPALRGRVVHIRDRTVTVRFESTVDFPAIPPQGGLRPLPSDRVYTKQLEAIGAIRKGRAATDRLLPMLVDGHVLPYQPEAHARPAGVADDEQLRVFRRALGVRDALLVLGPPGTGKTWTIGEIVAACAARGERVLLTSHTNRAVDNVLERLPPHLRAVRVGNEDALTAGARTYLAETQVEALREEILRRTEGAAARLAGVAGGHVDRWSVHLTDRLAEATSAEQAVTAAAGAREHAVRRVTLPLRERAEAAEQAVARAEEALEAARRAEATARDRITRIASLPGLLRGVLGLLERPLRRRADRAAQVGAEAGAALTRARSELATAEGAARVVADGDPEVTRLGRVVTAAERHRDETLRRVEQAAAGLRSALPADVRPAPEPAQGPAGPAVDLAGRHREAAALARAAAQSRARATLLAQWRDRVPTSGASLQRELVKYADVVAATCIGTATTELLAELEFDVAVVDEAGQISLPNLLVPLARARRAVLVGDHRQLPPFLDEDVRLWAQRRAADPDADPGTGAQIGDLLTRSGFERLYGTLGEDHRDMLQLQRRMPEELATFVSRTFYNGRLRTRHPGGGGNPVFRSPFAMVTTADRPAAERGERRPPKRAESHGYVNPLEAGLIVELVTGLTAWHPDWGVILPYRAQVDLVRELLDARLGDPGRTAECVGTVDAFQGGERDLIIFGFVRSNDDGRVGFLDELRRLNVAISRARRQLVLVGDTDTLERAGDEKFRQVMQAMTAYLRHSGDLRTSAEITAVL